MPRFNRQATRTAVVSVTNPAVTPLAFTMVMYFGAEGAARSQTELSLMAGETKHVPVELTMPDADGVYPVFLDLWRDNLLIAHHQASEEVEVVAPEAALPTGVKIGWLDVAGENAIVGEAFLVRAQVTNTSGQEGEFVVTCNVNGHLEEQTVHLPVGGTDIVSWWITAQAPGTLIVVVDDLSTSITIEPLEAQLRGCVSDNRGQPLGGVSVSLQGTITYEVMTNATGGYLFYDVVPGTYTMRLYRSAYNEEVFVIDVTTGPVDLGEMILFYIEPTLPLAYSFDILQKALYELKLTAALKAFIPAGGYPWPYEWGDKKQMGIHIVIPSESLPQASTGEQSHNRLLWSYFFSSHIDGEFPSLSAPDNIYIFDVDALLTYMDEATLRFLPPGKYPVYFVATLNEMHFDARRGIKNSLEIARQPLGEIEVEAEVGGGFEYSDLQVWIEDMYADTPEAYPYGWLRATVTNTGQEVATRRVYVMAYGGNRELAEIIRELDVTLQPGERATMDQAGAVRCDEGHSYRFFIQDDGGGESEEVEFSN